MYSFLEKELGPSLLVERLSERSCAVKNKPHEVNHTSFCGKCVELASNRVPCRQSADDGKNQNYKTGWGGGPDLSVNNILVIIVIIVIDDAKWKNKLL